VIKRNQIVDGANKQAAENPKKEKELDISGVLKDFLESRNSTCGYGMFEGVLASTIWAEKVGKSEFRRLQRYGVVPTAFIEFLGTMGIVLERYRYSRKEMTEGCLASMLMTGKYVCKDEKTRSDAEYIGKMILLTKHPELAISFRVTQDMESEMSLYAIRKKVTPLKT
jgi:hypothetical protein